MMSKPIAILYWIKDNVLAVLVASFIIPGVLAVFNQQSEITKIIYETDYKDAKTKFQECDRLHSDYLSSAVTNMGTAQFIENQFNMNAIKKNGSSQVFFLAFNTSMETYQKSLKETKELFSKTSQCYSELTANYENLALSLNLIEEFQNETQKGSEKISNLLTKRNATKKDILENTDLEAMFQALISEDEAFIEATLQQNNFGTLAELQSKNIEVESAVQNQQRAQFVELNKLFSKELSRRFHRGLLSYFCSLFTI